MIICLLFKSIHDNYATIIHTWISSGRGHYDEMKSQEMKHCWQTKISSLKLSLWLQLHIRRLFSFLLHRLKLMFCVDLKILITYEKDLWWVFESLDTFFLYAQTCFRRFLLFYDNNNWGMTTLEQNESERWKRETYQTSISRFSQIYWKVFFISWQKRNVVKANTYLFRHEGKRHQK
jgi:hypothetical protein